MKIGETPTPATELHPFHKDEQGHYFTSDDIRSWEAYNYSYPQLQPWLPKYKGDHTLYIRDLNKIINNLYVPTRNLLLQPQNLSLAIRPTEGTLMMEADP